MLVRKFLHIAGIMLAKCPPLLALALNLRLRMWRLRVRLGSRRWAAQPDVNKTYWVDPKKIEYACVFDKLEEYDKYRYRGKVIGGNWDQRRIKFTERIGLFKGFEDRFKRGMNWRETEFYQQSLKVINNVSPLWGCRNQDELDERCKWLDRLFEEIKVDGYKPQSELPRGKQDSTYKYEDEVTVRIGHDGALLFEDGQHRLAIAKLLNIDKIPIKITARHSEWYQFRKEILEYARTNGGKIYQPITHPDLSDIPSMYGEERFELIRAHMPIRTGTLLDIGAHWGYFCHRFEELGLDCYAGESDTQAIYFLEKLKQAENRKFKVVRGSIFEYRDKADFDVVLALNIFHHFIKTEETFTKLVELLKRLNMKFMFFQPELPDSPQMQGAYKNFTPNEFVQFILDNSNLNEANYIGQTSDRRPIYRLQRL
jgi:hypothetical protein